jgi:hypothetical protein
MRVTIKNSSHMLAVLMLVEPAGADANISFRCVAAPALAADLGCCLLLQGSLVMLLMAEGFNLCLVSCL